MKAILNVIVISLFLFPSMGYGEVKEIIAEGTYNMGDGETPTVAESRALLNAKRIAIEQAGTYIESYSKVKNFQLTHDEIQLLASGVMEVIILQQKRSIIEDGFKFWVKIKATVSTDKIEEMAKRIKEKSSTEDYKEDLKQLQTNYEKLTRDIEILKSQLKEAKSEKEKHQVEAKITDSERLFQANEWFEKGRRQILDKKYDDALKSYTSGISLNSNFAPAYVNRGHIFAKKGLHDKAMEDFNKGIALGPNDAVAYFNRGHIYEEKGLYDRAIEDYNKAIALNPNFVPAYINRASAYEEKGLYDRAIEDSNKAIALDPNEGDAYVNRGSAFFRKRQYDKALEDFNKAIVLNPNDAMAYNNRGLTCCEKGEYDRGLEDFNKAIALNPNNAMAYNNRGLVYRFKGENGRAIEDFNKAIALEPNNKILYQNRDLALKNIRPRQRSCLFP